MNEPIDTITNEEDEDEKVVETDETETYLRFESKLGSGAFKTVYRALDRNKGIEVAWNQVMMDRFQLDEEKVLKEIEFFKKITHKHVIDFYDYWVDRKHNKVVFITELMPSGTLTDYLEKSPGEMKLKVIKSWCKQILSGLDYLHTQTPPIIHRDIKCANIFINGTTGEENVKIGDLGLATFCMKKEMLSVIGTPEFMAPEYYDETYTTSVDIWAFGMAMIEMVTQKCPYSECDNVGQIFRKVSGGIRPQQLQLIKDVKVKEFISLCLEDAENRPSAEQLLDHSFFTSTQDNDNFPVALRDPSEPVIEDLPKPSPTPTPAPTSPKVTVETMKPLVVSGENDFSVDAMSSGSIPSSLVTSPLSSGLNSPEKSENSVNSSLNSFDMDVIERNGNVLTMQANIAITMPDKTIEASEVDFDFNLLNDDPKAMAEGFREELELQEMDGKFVLQAFEKLVQKHGDNREKSISELSDLADLDPVDSSGASETLTVPTPGFLPDIEDISNLENLLDDPSEESVGTKENLYEDLGPLDPNDFPELLALKEKHKKEVEHLRSVQETEMQVLQQSAGTNTFSGSTPSSLATPICT